MHSNPRVLLVLVLAVAVGACSSAGNRAAPSAGSATTLDATGRTTATTGETTRTMPVTPTDPARPFPTEATQLRPGDRVFGVFVAVERTTSAPEIAQAKKELQKAGYRVAPGATDINCDQGAREVLRLTPGVDYFVEAVYFRTREEAQQFVDAFEPGVVGTAEVTAYCRD